MRATPTQRELEILAILWRREEATVREVYEEMRAQARIVQNTVQAFLRTMEEKELVAHRVEGRAFVYRAVDSREQTGKRLAARLLDGVFDGAIDMLVQTLFNHRRPSEDDIRRLEETLAEARRSPSTRVRKEG